MNLTPETFLLALTRESLAASVLVILVLLAQRGLKKYLTPGWSSMLWLLVIVRLLPFSLNSGVSVFNLLPSWMNGPTASATSGLAPVDLDSLRAAANPNPQTVLFIPSENTRPTPPPSDGPGIQQTDSWFARPSWLVVLFWVWVAGVAWLSIQVARNALSLSRILARASTIDDTATVTLLDECCALMHLRRAPILIESGAIQTPALTGLFRPRLVLPENFFRRFSKDELRFVFLHELAHLRRHDVWVNWVMVGLQILHWFNPLIWLGFARWRVDREIACDAAALEAAGVTHRRAYGETILRLLDHCGAPVTSSGLVGILEDRRQLRRRLSMIAAFAPHRRSWIGCATLGALALAGITDAQVTPAAPPDTAPRAADVSRTSSVPALSGPYTLVLVSGAETMLGDSWDEVTARRTQSELQKTSAPKWQRTAEALQTALTSLATGTQYRAVVWHGTSLTLLGEGRRDDSDDAQAIEACVQRLKAIVPQGQLNLEEAFRPITQVQPADKPARIVMIADGLPDAGLQLAGGESPEATRTRFFQSAQKFLPPRVPVDTILLPLQLPNPDLAAGAYWSLANATRGSLKTTAKSPSQSRTHLAFVIDTSGSMRDPRSGGLWPIVIDTLEASLDAHPHLEGLQVIDGDGRFVLGRRGTGKSGWLPNTPETRDAIRQKLRKYDQDTVSNPVPGIYNAFRFLDDKRDPAMRMGIYLFGDEFNSSDSLDTVIQRLDKLNPANPLGERRVVIHAIGFPTTIRYQLAMGNTGVKFAQLMRTLTYEHGGVFIALQDL